MAKGNLRRSRGVAASDSLPLFPPDVSDKSPRRPTVVAMPRKTDPTPEDLARKAMAHSVRRPWQTINHPGNARTGTRAFGPTPRRGFGLRRARHAILSDAGGSATTVEFLVVNLITEHDVEAHRNRRARATFAFGRPRRRMIVG